MFHSCLHVQPRGDVLVQKFVDEIGTLKSDPSVLQELVWRITLDDVLLHLLLIFRMCANRLIDFQLSIKWKSASDEKEQKNAEGPRLRFGVVRLAPYNLGCLESYIAEDAIRSGAVSHNHGVCEAAYPRVDGFDVMR